MFIVANCLVLFIPPLLWARVINVVQEQGVTKETFKTLLGLLVLIPVIDLIFWLFHGPARVLERANAFKARGNYRKYLLRGIMALPMEWHAGHHSGDTIDKVEKGTDSLYRFSGNSFEIISAVVQLVGSYVMLVYLSPSSFLIVFGMMVVTAGITMSFDKVILAHYKELNHAENGISESVFDTISNITTVIILRAERKLFKDIGRKIDKPYQLYLWNNIVNEMKWFLTNMCCKVMAAAVLGVYFWQNIGGTQIILGGSVYLLINYLNTIGDLFYRFAGMYGDILQQKAKVMNAEEVALDFKEESLTNHVLPVGWKKLEIKNLNFSHTNSKEGVLHLDNVKLSLHHGERIALVGSSGSGKTTLLHVIRDLFHPETLELMVDGQLIEQGFEGISQAIALIPQEPEIFSKTILENITLGAEYDPETVRTFTDLACFTQVAKKQPKGLDSSINERGVNLSGGEGQRLALARGLLASKGKDIILLDEPTSKLDSVTERRVYESIFREFEDQMIISTIHRLHLLSLFDRVYLFESGKIIASGTVAELRASSPEFKNLWSQYHSQTHEEIPA
ncbi:MAG: ABC transporter ATP-binding protein [Candidatus Pacebacteria bacterium]|nr:ABC transporter ATP-binding protein [Candidatus Paceibacterota bacterium]